MFNQQSHFKIAVLGNIMRGGIGDEIVCIPCLYALKSLYFESYLTLFVKNQKCLLSSKKLPYIDEVLEVAKIKNDSEKKFDILLVIEHHNLKVLEIAESIQAKRKIVTLSQSLLLHMPFLYLKYLRKFQVCVNPYWLQTHNEIQRNLNLVRQINPKTFGKTIKSLDFSLAKLPLLEASSQRIKVLLWALGKGTRYKQVIGIFPFARSLIGKVNFNIKEWIILAQALSKEFSEILFVFVNYRGTQYHFAPFTQENLKVFYNEQGLEDLIAFVQSCDGILGVDSGHIHLADNAKIPTLEVMVQRLARQWSGGFYGGYFSSLTMPLHWREEEQKYLESFLQKARDLILFVKNHKEF
ncbi:glycosyltransferase family 9 protein [Helicobacter sp. UBA3407]|uniref:glycosyltransferase family 9 protein n=2 Tax=Helicobacter TaxID=209 RepID=UPI00260FAD56|nr:hypothetical protein [Helicobacter sp. UBA3407]